MLRTFVLALYMMIMASGYFVYNLKYEVQDKESLLLSLQKQVNEERLKNHVLRAEWAHLNRPERLHYLAEKYLDPHKYNPNKAVNITDILDIPEEKTKKNTKNTD